MDMSSMKTPATVLQEMMVKLGTTPEYDCIAQSGPDHSSVFEYQCRALGVTVSARARSKKEAKQEAAAAALRALGALGAAAAPSPAAPAPAPVALAPAAPRSAVALLQDLCIEVGLPAPQYDLVGDAGPPHLRQFTMRAQVSAHAREATATTKKAARQLAADSLYRYLRENLARLTKDFDEEKALVRAHDRVMDRYREERDEATRRPDLGQRVAEYHAVGAHLGPAERDAAAAALAAGSAGLEHACAVLGLAMKWGALGPLVTLALSPGGLLLAGPDEAAAREDARMHLSLALKADLHFNKYSSELRNQSVK